MVIAFEKKITLSLMHKQILTRQSIHVKINEKNETKVRSVFISINTADTSSIPEP